MRRTEDIFAHTTALLCLLRLRIPCMGLLILVFFAMTDIVVGQSNTRMNWYGTSGGFGPSSFADTRLTMDIGQPFVGRSSVSNTIVEGGFLVHPFLVGPLVGVTEQEGLPAKYDLFQNYPNPFNPSTTIRYALPRQSHVVLTIYNILGQEVTRLVDEVQDAGVKHVVWNARSATTTVASGVYFYRLEAVSGGPTERFTQVRKLMVLK